MKLEHQFDDTPDYFRHRLVPEGTPKQEESASGKWVGYTRPASYHTTKGVFVAVTKYYEDSAEFPNPNKIYWIREAPESI